MPQSAKDQVEPGTAIQRARAGCLFQCLSRQTIKWNVGVVGRVGLDGHVSMPQSANDQVEQSSASTSRRALSCFNASVGKRSSGTRCSTARLSCDSAMFQCLSRQTIKWNQPHTFRYHLRYYVSMPQSANDQVERPGCGCGPRWPNCFNASVGKRSSGTL